MYMFESLKNILYREGLTVLTHWQGLNTHSAGYETAAFCTRAPSPGSSPNNNSQQLHNHVIYAPISSKLFHGPLAKQRKKAKRL